MKRKGISAIISIILLISLSLITTVAFQGWFTSFTEELLTEERLEPKKPVEIQQVIGGKVYVRNTNSAELTITSIFVNNRSCPTQSNLSSGISAIDLASCLDGKEHSSVDVILHTPSGIFSKTVFVKKVVNRFQPNDITSLKLWIHGKTSENIQEEEGNVSSVEDMSGYGNGAFSSGDNRPSYLSEDLNNKGTFFFDGSDEYLEINSSSSLSMNKTVTIAVLVNFTEYALSNAQSILRKNNAYILQKTGDNKLCFAVWNEAGTLTDWKDTCIPQEGLENNRWMIVVSTFNGTHYEIFRNGNLNDSDPTTARGINTNSVNVGIASSPGNFFFEGQISEILVFNTSLSSSKRQNIEGYLAHEWQKTNLLPDSHPYKQERP